MLALLFASLIVLAAGDGLGPRYCTESSGLMSFSAHMDISEEGFTIEGTMKLGFIPITDGCYSPMPYVLATENGEVFMQLPNVGNPGDCLTAKGSKFGFNFADPMHMIRYSPEQDRLYIDAGSYGVYEAWAC